MRKHGEYKIQLRKTNRVMFSMPIPDTSIVVPHKTFRPQYAKYPKVSK